MENRDNVNNIISSESGNHLGMSNSKELKNKIEEMSSEKNNFNKKGNSATEDKSIAMELLRELKEQSKRWFRAFLVMVAVEVLTIAGFIWYLYQYDFTSTIEQTGVYTLIDSSGNVISADITPEQINEILEIINNGENKSN